MTALTLYAVEQTGTNGVIAVYAEDIRGTYYQARAVMAGRIVAGTQRVVQMDVSGEWSAVAR